MGQTSEEKEKQMDEITLTRDELINLIRAANMYGMYHEVNMQGSDTAYQAYLRDKLDSLDRPSERLQEVYQEAVNW